MASPLQDNPRSPKTSAKEPEKKPEAKPAAEAKAPAEKPAESAEGEGADKMLAEFDSLSAAHEDEERHLYNGHKESVRSMRDRHRRQWKDLRKRLGGKMPAEEPAAGGEGGDAPAAGETAEA